MVGLQTFNFAIPPLAFSFLRPQCRCPLYPQKRTCGAASGYGNSRLSGSHALAATEHHLRDAVVRPVSRASRSGTREPLCFKSLSTGATPQRCPIFGRGVPKTAIAPTTSSQNGATPTPGIASRTSPGKSSRCQPSTTNNSTAVTTSIAHTIGGAKLAKAPMTSDTPAMRKATASRDTENLRGVETVVSVDRFSNSEGAGA
jgi:hypothetical protein